MDHRWLAVTALVALCPQGCAFIQEEIAEHGVHGHGTGGSSTTTGAGGAGPHEHADCGAPGAGNDTPDAAPPEDDAAVGTSYLRFANFLYVSGNDYCLRPHDAANAAPFTIGPVLASRGIASGLGLGFVTTYFPLPSGQYDVRFVAAGATDCATRLDPTPQGQDLNSMPGLARDTSWSFVLQGSGNTGRTMSAFHDERAPVDGRALLRFAHIGSYSSQNLDFGFGAGDAFNPLFTDVPRFGVGSGPGVDALGYAAFDPTFDVTMVIRHRGGTGDVSRLAGVDLPPGAVLTAFSGNGVGGPIFLCNDAVESAEPVVSCQFTR